jgi:hypothetical protein
METIVNDKFEDNELLPLDHSLYLKVNSIKMNVQKSFGNFSNVSPKKVPNLVPLAETW